MYLYMLITITQSLSSWRSVKFLRSQIYLIELRYQISDRTSISQMSYQNGVE